MDNLRDRLWSVQDVAEYLGIPRGRAAGHDSSLPGGLTGRDAAWAAAVEAPRQVWPPGVDAVLSLRPAEVSFRRRSSCRSR